ncbi:MAG: NUDIX hydrolase [Patescibacteria group bacterium]|nr:NUDIX hydrolase [Patescibacteria group bacterium]
MPENTSSLQNNFYRVSIKALILDDKRRFLLLLENDGWDLPGGGLNFGEKISECLSREIEEETGLKVIAVSERPSYFSTTLHRSGQWWVCNIIYEVKVKDFRFKTSSECLQMKFFSRAEASKENLLSSVAEFVKIFSPKNHGIKTIHKSTFICPKEF